MCHRAIICASLAKGISTIHNVTFSKDIQVTMEGMKQLGAQIQQNGSSLTIKGISSFQPIDKEIDCHESGSTLRFFLPLFSLTNAPVTLTGTKRLMQRPQSLYQTIFHEQGLSFLQKETSIQIEGRLKPQTYTIRGDVSSQFISGLLFTLPLLKNDSVIQILPPFESRSYVDLTIQMLQTFGIQIQRKSDTTLYIQGNQSYQAIENYSVEGDFSQLAFFAALGVLNHDLCVTGIRHDSLQGDQAIIPILQQMQAHIEPCEHGYTFYKSDLRGCMIDLQNCPDLGPILCVIASCAKGETRIINAKRLRLKESDRIATMEEELRKFNVCIQSTENEIIIQGQETFLAQNSLHGHNDHRIVMALSILASISKEPCTIEQAESITKSYPDFFKDLSSTGIEVELYD